MPALLTSTSSEPSAASARLRQSPSTCAAVAEVAGQHGAVPAEVCREGVERVAARAGQGHAGALRPERAGDGAAEAARWHR